MTEELNETQDMPTTELEAEQAPAEEAPKRTRKKLDLTKPHGVVYGTSKARYHQDGVYYDVNGKKVGTEL